MYRMRKSCLMEYVIIVGTNIIKLRLATIYKIVQLVIKFLYSKAKNKLKAKKKREKGSPPFEFEN